MESFPVKTYLTVRWVLTGGRTSQEVYNVELATRHLHHALRKSKYLYNICLLQNRPMYVYLILCVRCRFQSSNCGAFTWCFDEDENMIIHGNYECYDIEDCQINWYFGLDNYQTLNSKLDMKCENNKCISRNLWSNIPYVEDESGDMYKKLDNILGVQKIYR